MPGQEDINSGTDYLGNKNLEIAVYAEGKTLRALKSHLLQLGLTPKQVKNTAEADAGATENLEQIIVYPKPLDTVENQNEFLRLAHDYPYSAIVVHCENPTSDRLAKALSFGAVDCLNLLNCGAGDWQKLAQRVVFSPHYGGHKLQPFVELSEGSSVAQVILDPEQLKIVYANAAAVKLYGYSHSDFQDKDFNELWLYQSEALGKKALQKTHEKQLARHKTASGNQLYVDLSLTKPKGQLSGYWIANLNYQTRRIELQHKIAELKEKFQYSAEAVSDLVYDWNLESNQIEWSTKVEDFLAIEPHHNPGFKEWLQFLHPEDKPRILNQLDELISGTDLSHKIEREYRILRNEHYAYVRDNAIVLREQNGKAYRIIGAIEDITEKKNEVIERDFFSHINLVNGDLLSMEERFQHFLKSLATYTEFELAEGWIISGDNRHMLRIAEYETTQELTENADQYLELQRVTYGEGLPGIAWQSGEVQVWYDLPHHQKFVRKKEAGKAGIHTAIGVPVKFYNHIVGVVVLMTPAKDRVYFEGKRSLVPRLGEKLGPEFMRMKSEDELRRFFEVAPDILTIISTEGQFISASGTVVKKLGINHRELYQKTIFQLLHKDDQPLVRDEFSILINGGESTAFECRIKSAGGEYKWYSLTATYDSRKASIYAVLKDIQENKELQNLLLRTNEMAQVGSWEYNFKTQELFWSDVTRQIHEVDENHKLTMESVLSFYPSEEVRQEITEKYEKLAKGEQPGFEVVGRIITAGKNEKWVRSKAEMSFDEGKPSRIYGSVQDITRQKHAEERFRAANARYRMAADINALGVWEWKINDPEKLIWDEAMCNLYGLELEHKVVKMETWKAFVHPDDRDAVLKKWEMARKNHDNISAQYRIVKEDGVVRYIGTRGEAFHNESGEVEGLIGINIDVTEEIEMAQRLAESNREKEDILESIASGFLATDRENRIIYCNKAAENALQVKRREILEKKLFDDAFDDWAQMTIKSYYDKARARQTQVSFQEYLPKLKLWLDITIYPRKYGMAVYLRDISAEKQHQSEVWELQNLQKHVINSTEDIIWAIDKEYRLILANDAYFREMKNITGREYRINEKVGSALPEEQLFSQDESQGFLENYGLALQGKSRTFKYRIGQGKEKERIYAIEMRPIFKYLKDGEKEITGVAGFAHEITERLQHIEAIEQQNSTLKEIAWIQSHVVRAPLARILGLIDLIVNLKENEIPLEELLGQIESSARELDQEIKNIVEKAAEVRNQSSERINKVKDKD